jgi:hypothetical protein
MKLLVSILLTLALLLSAASNGIANSPNQGGSSAKPSQNKDKSALPSPNALAEQKVGAQSASQSSQSVTNDYGDDFNYCPKKAAIPWREMGDVASVLATIIIAVFTVGLWKVSKWQWQTLEKQSGILKQQTTMMLVNFEQRTHQLEMSGQAARQQSENLGGSGQSYGISNDDHWNPRCR